MRSQVATLDLPVRAGVHAGEVEVHDDRDGSGFAVNLAARVEEAASGGEILVSQTVRDLAMGSGWTFAPRGEFTLKGIDGTWQLHALEG